MAVSSKERGVMPADILYLITFAAGMAAFWLSGHASILALQNIHTHGLRTAAGLIVTGGVYGLGMLILASAVMRRLGKGAIIATVAAVALGLGAAQVIVRLAAGHIHTNTGLGLLTFALYMCYGLIYVVSLAAARRIAK